MAVENTGCSSPGLTGSTQAGINAQNVVSEGSIARGEASADQAARWNAMSDKGAAIQFEGKAAAYGWTLLNKSVDNAMKSLG